MKNEIILEDIQKLVEQGVKDLCKEKPKEDPTHISRFDRMSEEEYQFWKDEHQ